MTFNLLSSHGAIMLIAYFFAGIVDAISGGGGLILVPAALACGISGNFYAGTNQVSMLLGTGTALTKYAKEGQINWKCALWAVPFVLIGGFFGSKLNLYIAATAPNLMKIVMIALVPIIAVIVFLKKDFGKENHVDELSNARLIASSAIIGLVIGAYQTLYGVGAGTFYLLAFCALEKLDLTEASGCFKATVLAGNLVGTITYALAGSVIWNLGIAAAIVNILGSYLGASIAIKRGSKIIRPLLLVIMVLLIIKVAYDLLSAYGLF